MTRTTEYARLTREQCTKAKAAKGADDAWTALHHANAAAAHARAATNHAQDADDLEAAEDAREKAAEALNHAAVMIRFSHLLKRPA